MTGSSRAADGDAARGRRRPRSVYTIADGNLFLGAVALVNSLRLLGYRDGIVLLDCGLSPLQRETLSREVELLEPSERLPPTLLKWVAPLRSPAESMLLLDADVILTQPLDDVFRRTAAGRIVVAADTHPERFFPEWQTLLDLPPLRRATYVNAGLIGLPGPAATPLLEAIRAAQSRLDLTLTRHGGAERGAPLYHGDQNVWNAFLCTAPWVDMVDVLDGGLAPQFPFGGVSVADAESLRCVSSAGPEPLLLHHILAKPWLKPVRRNAYVVLLERLLDGDDLAVRVPPSLLPSWLRPGSKGRLHRIGYDAAALARSQRGRLGIRRRLVRSRRLAAQWLAGLAVVAGCVEAATQSGEASADPGVRGDVTFQQHVLPAAGLGQVVEALGVGRVAGETRPSVVVAGDRYLLRYRSPTARPELLTRGTFGSGAQTIVVDVDGDGRGDVVTGQTLPDGRREEVWFARTPDGWRRQVLSDTAYCHDIAFAKVEPGTGLDAVCVDQRHDRIVLLVPPADVGGTWSATTIAAGVDAAGLAVADVDRDGRLDVVAGRSWYRNGAGRVWTAYPYTTETSAAHPEFDDYAEVAVVDLNGDGRPDIVASLFAESPDGRLEAFLAPTDPREPGWTTVRLDPGPLFGVHGLVVGRFDGGCRPELAVAETNVGGWDFGPAPDPHVFLYRPSGTTGWSRIAVDSVGAHDLRAVDLDGDGRVDLVGHEENTDRLVPARDGRVFWWRNTTATRPDGERCLHGAPAGRTAAP